MFLLIINTLRKQESQRCQKGSFLFIPVQPLFFSQSWRFSPLYSLWQSLYCICLNFVFSSDLFQDIRGTNAHNFDFFFIPHGISWLWFSNRFDLALVLSEIDRIKESHEGPTPKMIYIYFFFLILSPICARFSPLNSYEECVFGRFPHLFIVAFTVLEMWEDQQSYFNDRTLCEMNRLFFSISRLDWA